MKDNINEIESSEPFTVWDDLAKSDVLIEYVHKFKDSNINNSPELNSTVLKSIYSYSNEVAVEVERFYCEKYYLCLKKFLDRIQKCREQIVKQ
jgi:hypothetical protein